MQDHSPPTQDPKAIAILHAAFATFNLYGYRRTSMADIAKGAGVSRAALYLHFKNKEDILRGMMQQYYLHAGAEFAEALHAPGVVQQQLLAGFSALSGEAFRTMLNSPHGAELLDVKAEAGEVVSQGEAALVAALAAYLTAQSDAGRIDLAQLGQSAQEAASVMMQAYKGQKMDGPSYEDFCANRDRLIRIFAASLVS